MGKKKGKAGKYSSVINILVCALLIGLVSIALFGNEILKILPDSISSKINLSSFIGYLPLSEDGVVNGAKFYVWFGKAVEPQAIILQAVIYLSIISLVLSVLSLFTGKRYGRRIISLVIMLVALGAIVLFTYTYELSLDGQLWSEINAFFTSIFSVGVAGGVAEGGFGSFIVFTTYLLIAGLGITSFLVSNVNK
ncbi:MAG: hypothetical protein LBT30_02580 [Clostridiales bacterium]|jgi:hypothetical protein|nr:hypothetical protein [Clostridiales bacterium]